MVDNVSQLAKIEFKCLVPSTTQYGNISVFILPLLEREFKTDLVKVLTIRSALLF